MTSTRQQQTSALPRPAPRDLVVVLGRLARLRDADVLTEDEFQRERVKIVEGWTSPKSWRPDPSRDQSQPAKAATPPGP
jgi:hypothetical protein